MAFHRLTASYEHPIDHDKLPWNNVWYRQNKAGNQPFKIEYVLQFDTGLMVVCKHYKAYLYVGDKQQEDLLEAMEVFRESKTPELMLYIELDGKGKPVVLRNDEEECLYWHKTENRFVQVFHRTPPSQEEAPRENPLLAGRAVQGSTRERKRGRGEGLPKEPS